MLVIRRRAGQSIQIGEDVTVEILELEGNRVKLGINAPRGVPVIRSEALLAAEQNRQASLAVGRWRELLCPVRD